MEAILQWSSINGYRNNNKKTPTMTAEEIKLLPRTVASRLPATIRFN